jgi:hypothetical protein
LAADRATLRQPDPDRRPRAPGARQMSRLTVKTLGGLSPASRERATTSRPLASASRISASARSIVHITRRAGK